MILLTKLDNTPVLVQTTSIKFAESTPDTLISFNNGDQLLVKESLDSLKSRMVEWTSLTLAQKRSPSKDPAPVSACY